MKRTEMLCKNYEFERVFRKGKYYNSKYLTIYVRPRLDDRLLLGVTVSKHVKGSVRRNQVKRWLREVYRSSEDDLCSGYEIVMFGRLRPELMDFHKIQRAWYKLIKDADIYCPKTAKNSHGKG
ncbi:MAG: ribonuclease P protein component [Clostridiaceae bacterium]|nr:ribonuclease P protein component [Clostridiaceae bacterium]